MKKKKILIFGDSLCSGLCFSGKFNVHVESIPGLSIQTTLDSQNDEFGCKFYFQEDNYDCIYILLGTNDLSTHCNYHQIAMNLATLALLAKKYTEHLIIALTFNTNLNIEIFECFESMDNLNISICDYFTDIPPMDRDMDQLHLNSNGKQRFVEYVETKLVTLIK